MKKIVITFGLISGSIVSVFMLATMPLWKNGMITPHNGQWVGYTTMVIALSVIFFGIKSYRDNYQRGSITFWQGLKIGLWITLIASVLYALTWEFCYNIFMPDFIEQMSQYYLESKKGSASQAELASLAQEMKAMKEWYKNPLLRFGITLAEIFPVGIVIALISAGLLRKKEILPANA